MIIQRGSLDLSTRSNLSQNSSELTAYKAKQLNNSNLRRQEKLSSSTLPMITPSNPFLTPTAPKSPKNKHKTIENHINSAVTFNNNSINNDSNNNSNINSHQNISHTSTTYLSENHLESSFSPSPPPIFSPHRSPIRSHLPPVSPGSTDLSCSTSSIDKDFEDLSSDSDNESHSSLDGEDLIASHYSKQQNNQNDHHHQSHHHKIHKSSNQPQQKTVSSSSSSTISSIPKSTAIVSVGFENLGNTCFMNSALQCLVHIKPLVKYFLDNQHKLKDLINPKSPRHGVLAKAFLQLLLEISKAQENCQTSVLRRREIIKPIAPINFQNAVGKFAPYLLDYQQQDCQEFLRFLLDGLSEDLCRTNRLQQNNSSNNNNNNISKTKIRVIQTINDSRLSLSNSSSSLENEKNDTNQSNNNNQTNQNQSKSSSIARLFKKMFKKNSKKHKKPLGDTPVSSELDENQSELSFSSTTSSSSTSNPVQPKINSFHYTKPLYDINELNKIHAEAEKAWTNYLKLNNSVITDYFGGLLQNTTICLTCNTRSYAFDPFLDLSVPISKEGEVPLKDLKNSSSSSFNGIASSILNLSISNDTELDKCLSKFTSEEYLAGDNIYKCEKCNQNREGIKRLSIYKYPKILIIQIKRFRYNYTSRDKINTNVKFPLNNFDISPFISYDSPYYPYLDTILQNITDPNQPELNLFSNASCTSNSINLEDLSPPVYDLIGVCNHHGSLNGGHYVAHVDTSFGENSSGSWASFNDAYVDATLPSKATGSSAYVLFYRLKEL